MNLEQRARIVLADDHADALAQAARILGERWDVVGTARHGAELLETVARLDPDVVVLDIGMPGMDGFEAARRLQRMHCRSRLVFLTVWEDPDYRAEAIRLGADGYVAKAQLASDLIPAVLVALQHRLPGHVT
ncbi:MAG: response regulator transcription factor [Gemmatimonadales bacterium]